MGDPGFSFYADNFLGGTILFTDDQVGKYMRALCAQKLCGHLTFEQLNVFAKNDPMIIAKFTTDENGLYYNVRLQKEIDKRSKYSDSQSEKANKRWGKDNAPASTGAVPGDMPGHIPGDIPGQCQGICRGNARAIGTDSLSDIVICSEKEKEKEEVQGKEKKETAPTLFCKRDGEKVPAERHGSYVLLTPVEYQRMVENWGEWFTEQAISEYDRLYPNRPAIKKHTDHNRAIRDYVNRGYICEGKTPHPQTSKAPTRQTDPTEIGTPEERAAALKNPYMNKRDGEPQSVAEILTGISGRP